MEFKEFKDTLVNRLKSLGYVVSTDDYFMLKFCSERIQNKIKNGTNQDEVPDELFEIFINMTCGEFLFMRNGEMTGEQKEAIVKRITEGENTIEFDTSTNVQKVFNNLVVTLRTDGENEFSKFRKLVW